MIFSARIIKRRHLFFKRKKKQNHRRKSKRHGTATNIRQNNFTIITLNKDKDPLYLKNIQIAHI